MRFNITLDTVLVAVAVFALLYFRNWQAVVFLICVLLYLVYRFFRRAMGGVLDDNEFLIDDDKESRWTAALDEGLDGERLPNHFRTDERSVTRHSHNVYEYRVNGTDIQSRLIHHKTEDIGEPEHFEVRDGVVLEADMRKLSEGHTDYLKESTEDNIASFKTEVEWSPLTAISWHGLKYFIISKKLPLPDSRRYLRSELERLKDGCAKFFQEAERHGLVRDDDSSSLDRLKVAEGKPRPLDEEIRALYQSAERFGITHLEFSWANKLCGVLQKLLGD